MQVTDDYHHNHDHNNNREKQLKKKNAKNKWTGRAIATTIVTRDLLL